MSAKMIEVGKSEEPLAPALDVRNLTCGYGRTIVLRDVNLTVPASSVTVLLGPNGAGKSTLLDAVSGFVKAPPGCIYMYGQDIAGEHPAKRVSAGLCHIPERRGIFRSLTVRENLLLHAPRDGSRTAVDKAAEAFPILGERINQLAGTLSGGQQQMLAMARAYVRQPSLILVDEASLGLAPVIVDEVFAFLRKICNEGTALLLVDQFVARSLALAQTAYVMTKGSVVFSGSAQELEPSELGQYYLGG